MLVSKLLPKFPTSILFLPNLKAAPSIPLFSVYLSEPKVIASVSIIFDEEILVSPIFPNVTLPSLQ